MSDSRSGAFQNLLRMRSVSLMLVSGLTVLDVQSALAQEKGWILTQRNPQMGGDMYTYISPSGLKWAVPKMGVNFSTTAPAWDMCAYNEKTKTYYMGKIDELRRMMTEKTNMRNADLNSNAWVKSSSGNVAGLRATQYLMRLQPGRVINGRRSNVVQAECWIADEIQIPSGTATLLRDVYSLPQTNLFPLKVSYKTIDGAVTTMLDTYRSQSNPIPPTYFAAPQGFALAKSVHEVFMDDETKQMFNDMAGEAGLDVQRPAQRPAQPVAARGGKTGMVVRGGQAPQGNNESVSAGDQLSKMLEGLKGK